VGALAIAKRRCFLSKPMTDEPPRAPDQDLFKECYRGRQRPLHHAAYMRMSKVLLALELCAKAGITLEGKEIFDYGFGAGTFFRYCPPNSRLFGVEIDPENVHDVQLMLRERGHPNAMLETIEIENWQAHPLLRRQYDVILCSHVLEHLPDPVGFLKTIRGCLRPTGCFLGLVPLNERVMDKHHVQRLNRAKIHGFAESAGLRVLVYLETDPWLYWAQSLFTREGALFHKVTQMLSLGLGVPATILGPAAWFRLGKIFAALTASKPTQAGFVLRLPSAGEAGSSK
jgi:SAM-dependent methyltransferase